MTIQKDGALVALGSLSENLMENETYMNALEGLIVQHVLPEFQNPTYPFMRERACWILMRYCDLAFDHEHNLQCCVQRILKALRDPELPVQMMAATSLRFLLDSDTAQKVIEPVLPQVLEEFFRLMNEIGLDDLVCSLERIIQRFGDQIVRIAPQLTVKLASMFKQLFKKDDSGEDDEAQMAALTTLECINTILEQTWEMPDMYAKLEPTIVPLLHILLHPNGEALEYFEQALTMLSWFTYRVPRFSPQLWQIFPLLYNAFDKYAVDYLESMLPVIDNYVSRETQAFLNMRFSGTTYVELLFRMANKVIERKQSGDTDRAVASKIFEILFLNCRGQVDGMLAPAMNTICGALSKMKNETSQSDVYRVIACMLYYNPAKCLQVMESKCATQQLFQQLFRFLKDEKNCFTTLVDKKTISLGLSSVIALPLNQLPSSVRNAYGTFVGENVKVLSRIHAQRQAKAKKEEEEDEDEDEDEVEVDSRQYDENEDAVTEEDQAYLKFLKQVREEGIGDEDGEEEDENDPDSPIGKIEAFVFFHDALRAQDVRVINQAEKSLPPQMRQMFQQVVAYASRIRSE